ncbi:MAG: hypothetical protein ACE5KW_04395 [Dehalococcoidia bacterium]
MLWVGQFQLVGGQAQEEGPFAAVFPGRPRGDAEPADLYMVVEPALPGSAEFCGQLIEAIGRLFHRHKLSLTGGLLGALKGAHNDLREWNLKSLKEHRVATGTSCLALRGQEAYLAQVGPASTYVRRGDQLRRASPHIPDAEEPLGLYDEFWPAFRRYDLSPGDSILLATTNLATVTSEEEIDAALALPPVEGLPTLFRQAHHLSDGAALLIACQP